MFEEQTANTSEDSTSPRGWVIDSNSDHDQVECALQTAAQTSPATKLKCGLLRLTRMA